MPDEDGDAGLDELLAQLSPEEIEQLASELAGQMEGAPQENEAEQIPELAAAIEQQLGNNPEVAEATAPAPGLPEEAMAKQSAINFIKSAEYVEGFLEQAVNRGISLKQAVDLYDSAFTTTFHQLKSSGLKGDQHELDVDKDGKIEGEDLKKLRGDKKETSEEMDEKTAAYYEGVIERCREYGMTDAQAIEFVKSAAPKVKGQFVEGAFSEIGRDLRDLGAKIPGVGGYVKRRNMPIEGHRGKTKAFVNKYDKGVNKHNAKVDENFKSLKEKAPLAGAAAAGGATLGAIAGSGALGSKKKEEDKSKE
jgi:DNA-binding transcriptional regulator YhcF (GntR family)